MADPKQLAEHIFEWGHLEFGIGLILAPGG